MFILILILFVSSLVASATVRNNVLNVVQATGYVAQGIISRVWPVVRNTFAIVSILWIALWWYIGQKLGLPGWTFVFALAAPCLFFLIALWPLTTVKYKEKDLGRFVRPMFKLSAWLIVPAVIISALIISGTITLNFLGEQFPTTAASAKYFWQGIDVKTAAKTDPATKAKAIALLLQNEREDAAAKVVAGYYEEGKPEKAIDFIRQLTAEGITVRDVVSGNSTTLKPTAVDPAPAATPPAPKPEVAAAPAQKRLQKLCIDSTCYTAEMVTTNDNSISIIMSYDDGQAFFKGSLVGDHYEGDWWQTSSASKGKFNLRQNPDGTFTGWESIAGWEKQPTLKLS